MTQTPAGELNRATVPMPSTNPALVPPNPATVDTTYGCGEGVTVPVREGLFEGEADGEADLVGLKVRRAVTD